MLEIRHVTDTPSLRRAYDNIYSNQGILHSDSFYLWILSLLRPRPGRDCSTLRVARAGCLRWLCNAVCERLA